MNWLQHHSCRDERAAVIIIKSPYLSQFCLLKVVQKTKQQQQQNKTVTLPKNAEFLKVKLV